VFLRIFDKVICGENEETSLVAVDILKGLLLQVLIVLSAHRAAVQVWRASRGSDEHIGVNQTAIAERMSKALSTFGAVQECRPWAMSSAVSARFIFPRQLRRFHRVIEAPRLESRPDSWCHLNRAVPSDYDYGLKSDNWDMSVQGNVATLRLAESPVGSPPCLEPESSYTRKQGMNSDEEIVRAILMAENLEFDEGGSQLVEAFNATPGATARRGRLLSALTLTSGERVLEVGSGPGHLTLEMAEAVGPAGRVCGVDNSDAMNGIARARCSGQLTAEFHLGDATKLPFPDNHFNAAVSSQVFEYLSDVPAAFAEIYRVLRPGGRVVIHDTDWGTVAWHSSDPDRMRRILSAFDGHLVDPYFPRTAAIHLRQAGFKVDRQEVIVQFDSSYGDETVSYYIIEFIAGYVAGINGITADDVSAWAEDLRQLGANGEYFFSMNEYISLASKNG